MLRAKRRSASGPKWPFALYAAKVRFDAPLPRGTGPPFGVGASLTVFRQRLLRKSTIFLPGHVTTLVYSNWCISCRRSRMKLSHLNALRALEATLRRGTFTAAAEEMGVSVAAIGQQLRGLEDYLGLRLFDRLPSGVRPTPEARAVAEILTEGFGRIEDGLAQLRRGRDGLQITLSMTYHFLDQWMAPRLPRFYAAHPENKVVIEAGDRLVDLLSENFDAAIRFSREAGPALDVLDLHQGCTIPVCSPAFAEAHGLTPESRDLTGVSLYVVYDPTTDPAWTDWPDVMERYDLYSRQPVSENRTTGASTAVSGAGLVLMGLTQAFNDLRDGRLVAPLGPRVIIPQSYRYRLVWAAARRPNRALRNFRNWISRESEVYLAEASALLGVPLT